MSALLGRDASSRVADPSDAGTVYGRGYFGTPDADGLALDRYETVYLCEMGRLALVDGRGRAVLWPDLFRRATRAESGFGVRYIVYRDLRQRGYVVRRSPPPTAFAVLPRGGVLNKTPAKYWVAAYSERQPFDLAEIEALADRAHGAKKALLVAVVDEESDLTFYRLRRSAPVGSHPSHTLAPPGVGWLAEDRVVVFDPEAVAVLGKGLAHGSRIGERLELSLLEAAHLVESGQIALRDARSGRDVPLERLRRRAERLEHGFAERLAAYQALRSRQLVVKTGFKYGAHLRAYPRNPETVHARYLVRAVPFNYRAPWPELAGAVRVAQGVRKDLLLAGVAADGAVRFLGLERIRP
ncbi:MAG TPA: tRNA-intron lyase [Thermoplasmata archaeon]|nr:tRNA-intron lyase [Thermoplasmata archaeon]